ncbi:MAG: sterol-binding protein [Acidothermus sp.]|nr:sterol-binding protein [Acidothermus sp.]MCL6538911.1 hypothetical protein [Acidothermus sp.]
MASAEECRAAVERIAAHISRDRRAAGFERDVSITVTDLGLTFRGRLHDGVLDGITTTEAGRAAAVRMEACSDDLLRLANGELPFAQAWLTGRLRIHASLGDLLKLRGFL